MADISKINAVALANIAKLDAVLAANIAKVNGLVFTAAAGEFLLDTYTGAAAGYSVRRLATSATVLLRVRRDTAGGTGDDDEADVAYDSNNIVSLDSAISNASVGVTATTLGQFLNVGTVNGTTYTNPDSLTVTASCYVDTWYDQSGNANDAEQATETNQPQIHDGTVNTDLITENQKPAVEFDGTDDSLNKLFNTGVSDEMDCFVIAKDITNQQFDGIYSLAPNNSANRDWNDAGGRFIQMQATAGSKEFYSYLANLSIIHGSGTNQYLIETAMNSGTGYFWHSASQTELTDTYTFTPLEAKGVALACRWTNNSSLNAHSEIRMQEFIVYPTYQGTNRGNIRTDINSEYLIYQPTDAPTSGLLATYTGAAAAYSVRQLADTAVIAITVRRDSDDEEKRFGFDSNGDLDTTGIADFCTTANGYVSQWWDQSTNGNHASQGTAGSQPQIYNGTAVITENGKPAVEFDGSNTNLRSATSLTHTTASAFVTSKTNDVTQGFYNGRILEVVDASNQNGLRLNADKNDRSTCRWQKIISNSSTTLLFDNNANLSQNIKSCIVSTAQLEVYLNGSSQGTESLSNASVNTARIDIGSIQGTPAVNFVGNIQEIIFYTTDQDSAGNRTGIETDIDTYFSIT